MIVLVLLVFIVSFSVTAVETRIDNIRLYQPTTKSFSPLSHLYLDQGKIVEITLQSSKAKSAETIIDAKGKFALPGLIDLHVHLGSSGSNFGEEFQYLPVASHFNSNLYLG